MSQLPANKLVDEVVKRGLHPILKAAGYKKKGRTFYHETDDVIRVVNVQSSQWNTADSSMFTINLGLYFPAVREVSPDPPLNGLPKEYDCTLQERIGSLMPQHNDYWWEVTPSSDIDDIANEVGEAWKAYADKWIVRCSNKRVACDEAERMGNLFTAAQISVALSDRERTKELFKVVLEQSSPLSRRHFEAWGKRHDLFE